MRTELHMRAKIGRSFAAAVAGLVGVALFPAGVTAASVEPTEMFYVVAAHPDDEPTGWSFIENIESEGPAPDGVPADFAKAGTYTVFVILTQGEGTSSCLAPEDSTKAGQIGEGQIGEEATMVEGFDAGETRTGPYKYQGPGSPVGESDLGERLPLGDPWQGFGTQACKDARVASWHWFLDDMNKLDGSGTDMGIENDPRLDDDYVGLMCEPGYQGQGDGRPASKRIGCTDVWADEEGARVAFDLGNCCYIPGHGFTASQFTEEDVIAALSLLRDRRGEWGLPVLPQRGILSVPGYCTYNDPHHPDPKGDNPDHVIVEDVIFNHELGMGTRYGTIPDCPERSEHFQSADQQLVIPPDPATLASMDYVDPITEQREGAFVVNYGWLFPTYWFGGGAAHHWQQHGS